MFVTFLQTAVSSAFFHSGPGEWYTQGWHNLAAHFLQKSWVHVIWTHSFLALVIFSSLLVYSFMMLTWSRFMVILSVRSRMLEMSSLVNTQGQKLFSHCRGLYIIMMCFNTYLYIKTTNIYILNSPKSLGLKQIIKVQQWPMADYPAICLTHHTKQSSSQL